MPRHDRSPCTLFYWADWLADPDVRALSRDERGAYIDVLAVTHQTATPGVMSEDDVRRWAGYSAAEWPAHRDALARCFDVLGDGQWRQARVVKEHRRQLDRLDNARKGGFARQRQRETSEPQLQLGSADSSASHQAPRARDRFSVLGSRGSALPGVGDDSNRSAVGGRGGSVARSAPPSRRRVASRQKPREPDRSLPPDFVAQTAARFGLALDVAQHLAEKLLLEFDSRGYRSARSAFLTWCRREADTDPAVHADAPRRGNGTNGHADEPQQGDRYQGLVFWHGAWQSEDQARQFGWEPDR